MNPDPVYQRLREIGWRRRLTPAEQAELRAWLIAHPEAQADVAADAALDAALEKLPDAPVSSNFTARVLQAIEQEEAKENRKSPRRTYLWWVFWPRAAVATLVVGCGFLFWQHQALKQQELASVAREVANVQVFSDPSVLTDFEVIASLSPADDGLLALSEDLMALSK